MAGWLWTEGNNQKLDQINEAISEQVYFLDQEGHYDDVDGVDDYTDCHDDDRDDDYDEDYDEDAPIACFRCGDDCRGSDYESMRLCSKSCMKNYDD